VSRQLSQTTDAEALAAIDTSGYVLPAVKVPGRRGRKPKEFTPENDEVAALNAVERAELKAVDKAKAKDRKAKEKALLKDAFSSDTEASEEELEIRRQKLKALIKSGKERGFLTYSEINDHLPENIVDPEAIEGIIGTFNDMGIAVYEHAPDAETCCCPITSPPSPATTKPKLPPKRRCRPSTPTSAAPPTRSACTCAKWARSSC
jgi:RNA polymerase primary sigma factor